MAPVCAALWPSCAALRTGCRRSTTRRVRRPTYPASRLELLPSTCNSAFPSVVSASQPQQEHRDRYIVLVLNNVLARLVRVPRELAEAAGDLGANPVRTFWHV